jgi:hypothetical protein
MAEGDDAQDLGIVVAAGVINALEKSHAAGRADNIAHGPDVVNGKILEAAGPAAQAGRRGAKGGARWLVSAYGRRPAPSRSWRARAFPRPDWGWPYRRPCPGSRAPGAPVARKPHPLPAPRGGQAVALPRHGAVSPGTDMATLSPFCRVPGPHDPRHGRPVAAWAAGCVGRGVPRSHPEPPRPVASWLASRCLPLANSLMRPYMDQQLGDDGLGRPSGASGSWPRRSLSLGWTTGRWPHQDDPGDPRPGRPGGDGGILENAGLTASARLTEQTMKARVIAALIRAGRGRVSKMLGIDGLDPGRPTPGRGPGWARPGSGSWRCRRSSRSPC